MQANPHSHRAHSSSHPCAQLPPRRSANTLKNLTNASHGNGLPTVAQCAAQLSPRHLSQQYVRPTEDDSLLCRQQAPPDTTDWDIHDGACLCCMLVVSLSENKCPFFCSFSPNLFSFVCPSSFHNLLHECWWLHRHERALVFIFAVTVGRYFRPAGRQRNTTMNSCKHKHVELERTTPDSKARQAPPICCMNTNFFSWKDAKLFAIDPVVAFQTEHLLEKRAGVICRIVRSHVMKMVGSAQHLTHLKNDAVPLPNCQKHKSSSNLPCPVLRPPIVSPTPTFSTRLLLRLEWGGDRFSLPKNFYDSTFPSHCGHERCKMAMQRPVAQSVVLVSRCGSC